MLHAWARTLQPAGDFHFYVADPGVALLRAQRADRCIWALNLEARTGGAEEAPMLNLDIKDLKFTFLGAGIIAGVFIERLFKAGGVRPGQVFATDIRKDHLEELNNQFGIRVSPDNKGGRGFADVLFLAVPPNAVKSVLSEVRSTGPPGCAGRLVGRRSADLAMEGVLENPNPVLRVIPNTPSLIGRGMNPHCLGRHVRLEDLPFIARPVGPVW